MKDSGKDQYGRQNRLYSPVIAIIYRWSQPILHQSAWYFTYTGFFPDSHFQNQGLPPNILHHPSISTKLTIQGQDISKPYFVRTRCQIHVARRTGVTLLVNLEKRVWKYIIIIYIQRKIFFRRSFFLYSPCHYMRAWIRVLDAPGCYERAALQGSGLVRTVGPCAQRRVAFMPRAIATA